MSNKISVGQLAEYDAKRDAIHVAVAPVLAGEELRPGERVQIRGGHAYSAGERVQIRGGHAYSASGRGDGVVDPFLQFSVGYGERFWVFMQPNTVKDLRHTWSHPSFTDEASEPEEVEYDGCRGC